MEKYSYLLKQMESDIKVIFLEVVNKEDKMQVEFSLTHDQSF